jgi:hypothetical protein
MRRVLIEYLQHTQPEENAQEKQEGRVKRFFAGATDLDVHRDVHERKKYVLAKKKREVVGHVLPDEILEHEPDEEEIEASAPAPKGRYAYRASRESKRDVDQGARVVRRDFLSDLPRSNNCDDEEAQTEPRLAPHRRNACA